MSTFYLKYGDTLNALVVDLLDAAGEPFIASGVTTQTLFIRTADGQLLEREMELVSTNPAQVRYAWQEDDWNTSNVAGYLTKSVRHLMEYRLEGGQGRLTFPNGPFPSRFDVLCVHGNLEEGA